MATVKPEILAAFYAHRALPSGSLRTACYAPFASLYFNTNGDVLACCQNARFPLGNVERDSLDDIWRGARTAAIRKALMKDNFAAGCQFCQWQLSVGNYANSFIRQFDRYPVEAAAPQWPQLMEFAVSNTCNLECVMCLGVLSSSIRANREKLPPLPKAYGERFFAELRSYLPHLKYTKFLGGEPFLAAESFRIWELMEELGLSTPCHVTTNGTQYNSRVERILERHPVDLAVSLDAITPETFEAIRINARFDVVMENFARFHSYARQRGVTLTIPHCLMRQNWREFGRLLLFADEQRCQVYVNLVREPPECTLYTLPLDELQSIVRDLQREGESLRQRLTLNQTVWDETLADLHRHIEHSQDSTRAPFDTPYALVVHVRVEDFPAPEQRFGYDDAQAALELWAPQAARCSLAADSDERVTALGPESESFFGVRGDECQGRDVADLIELLAQRLGPLRHSVVQKSARYVDRILEFALSAGGVRQMRLFSWPTFSEFGTPLGAEVLAAVVDVGTAAIPDAADARAQAADWAQGRPILTLHTDRHDRVAAVEGELQPAALPVETAMGNWPEELIPAQSAERRVIEFVRRPGYEDRLYLWNRRGQAPLQLRAIRLARQDANGQVQGWTWLLAAAQSTVDSALAAHVLAAQRLAEWSPKGTSSRLEFSPLERLTKFDGALFGGLSGNDLLGHTAAEVDARLAQHWAAPQIVDLHRTSDDEDVTTLYITERGPLYARSIVTPRFDDAGRYAGTIQHRTFCAVGPSEVADAVPRILARWTEWDAAAERWELRTDQDRRLVSPLPVGPLAGTLKVGVSLRESLAAHWGSPQELFQYQAREHLENVWEFPGNAAGDGLVVRALTFPEFAADGSMDGWRITALAAAVSSRSESEADARMLQLLTDWDSQVELGELELDNEQRVTRASGPDDWAPLILVGREWIDGLTEMARRKLGAHSEQVRFSRHPDIFEALWRGEMDGEPAAIRALRRPHWNRAGELAGARVRFAVSPPTRKRARQWADEQRRGLAAWSDAGFLAIVELNSDRAIRSLGPTIFGSVDLGPCVGQSEDDIDRRLGLSWERVCASEEIEFETESGERSIAYLGPNGLLLVRFISSPPFGPAGDQRMTMLALAARHLGPRDMQPVVRRAIESWPTDDPSTIRFELATDLAGRLRGELPAMLAAVPGASAAQTLEELGGAMQSSWGEASLISERQRWHCSSEQVVEYANAEKRRVARSLRHPDFNAAGEFVGWRYTVAMSDRPLG